VPRRELRAAPGEPGGHLMATWAQFAAAEPELAAYGWELLREDQGYAYLATVGSGGAPRVHPVVPFVAEGMLLVTIVTTSRKVSDLRGESRYMLHATVGDNDTEFAVRGRAHEVSDLDQSKALRERQELNVIDLHADCVLFALDIDRIDAAIWDDGPPHRQTWRAPSWTLVDGSGRARFV
jgi:hypothetical protein